MNNKLEKDTIKVKKKVKFKLSEILFHLFFVALSVIFIYPVLLAVGISFTDENALVEFGYKVIPSVPSLEAYKVALNAGDLFQAYKVTIAATVCGTVIGLLIQMLYAYPLSRKSFKHRKIFTYYAYFATMFSGGLVPWYMVCTKVLHIDNTFFALFVPNLFSMGNVILLRTFINTNVPDEMIEAARIDGATEMGIFWRMVLPLSKAGMATIALFLVLGLWNNYNLAMMLVTKKELYTLQYYLQLIFLKIETLKQSTGVNTNLGDIPAETTRFAMCVLTMGPILFVYPFFQKYFVKGLVVGSVKG